MRWKRGHKSSNVEVRGGRGGGGGGAMNLIGALLPLAGKFAGRFGLPGIIVAVIAIGGGMYFCGGGVFGLSSNTESSTPAETNSEGVQFVSFVLDSVQDTMAKQFAAIGEPYREAKMVIFRGRAATKCGMGNAATGPFYCPSDQTVYIDLSFYEQLRRNFGAPGDFAQAYVIAHEVGHHAQNLLGALSNSRGSGPDSNSVLTELQADCYAGVWANAAAGQKLLEVGDIEEAMRAAEAIGDDNIQRKSGGEVRPESWTHGSSKQRQQAFTRGYQGGGLRSCGQ